MTAYGASQLANSFRTVRKNTIQVAEDIPESQYGFKAAEDTRTVAQMLTHIAVTPRIWLDVHGSKKLTDLSGYDFMAILGEITAEEQKPRSKAEIVNLLKTGGDEFAAFLEGLSDDFLAQEVIAPNQPTRTRLEGLMGAKEHEMHHRGQLMLIERMIGIIPHLTRQREEIMKQMQQQAKVAAAQTT